MAAKKKSKTAKKTKVTSKKSTKKKKTALKKAPAPKAKTRKSKTRTAKKAPARKAVKKSARKAAPIKKKVAAKKKQIVGEGDYAASRKFDKDQADFVKKNKASIPALAKEAERALEGPEGDALRDAEASAAGRSRDTF